LTAANRLDGSGRSRAASALAPQSKQPQFTQNRMHEAGPFFVGWGTLALINAGLAQGKNRSGLNWFLLSLLFGPFATFLLVVFFAKRSGPEA
jgi:hypothetical protein